MQVYAWDMDEVPYVAGLVTALVPVSSLSLIPLPTVTSITEKLNEVIETLNDLIADLQGT